MDLEDISMNPVSEVSGLVSETIKGEKAEVEVKQEVTVKVECCKEDKECCNEDKECCKENKECCVEKTCCGGDKDNQQTELHNQIENQKSIREKIEKITKVEREIVDLTTDDDVDVTIPMLEENGGEKQVEIIDLTKDEDDDEEGMDQDTKQQVNTALTLVLELYRAIMGCLLVIFVPQNCDGVSCSVTDNINNAGSGLHLAGLIFNFLTLVSLGGMYYFETRREFKMISYLESNSYKARDAESVGEALTKLSSHRKDKILKLNANYGRFGYASLALFGINSAVSGVVVFNNFLDAKTLTVFLTNVLFMSSKLGNVYEIINTEQNIFYSSFLTRKVQYNDVDPDKVEEIKLEV